VRTVTGRAAAASAAVSRSVRDIPDFPKPGVVFKDIAPLLADPAGFAAVVDALADLGRGADGRAAVDKVVGIEARGFILAAPVSVALGVGFVPARKSGKLPGITVGRAFDLEYGTATLELQGDSLEAGEQVLVIDDVLATGGTLAAVVDLVGSLGANVTCAAVLIELGFLSGRDRLAGVPLEAILTV
jgi:adenine phosphoribosyltransferase